MTRRSGVIASAPVGDANNATRLLVYATLGSTVGAPSDTGNGSPPGITDAKLVEWCTQRGVQGITFGWGGTGPRHVNGRRSYGAGGSLPPAVGYDVLGSEWYFQSMADKWGATPNTRNWWERCSELGVKNVAILGMTASWTPTEVFSTTWENDTGGDDGWGEGATGIGAAAVAAGPGTAAWETALQAAVNSPGWSYAFGDINEWAIALNTVGFDGIWFDMENDQVMKHAYPGMPGGQTEAQTRMWVKLRGAQWERIISTRMPGAEIFIYYARSKLSLNALSLIQATSGANDASGNIVDSFIAGLAGGVTTVINTDETYYRGVSGFAVGIGTETEDGHYNAQMYNVNGRNKRLSEHTLMTQSDAERLRIARNFKQIYFYWPTESGGGAGNGTQGYYDLTGEGWSENFADNIVPILIREAARWSQHGIQAMYAQSLHDLGWNELSGDAAIPRHDHSQFESAWQTYLVPGQAQTTAPTASIEQINGSSNPGATTYSTAAATITVSGTVTDDFAIDRVEWATDRAVAVAEGSPALTFVIDSSWNVLTPSILPKNTSLGRAAWHMTWTTEAIALLSGVNVLQFKHVNIHGLQTVLTLTVTRS